MWLPLVAFLILSCTKQLISHRPKLVIMITIDQLPEELFHRIENEFTGGFKWLLDHGTFFRNTNHEHAYTVTGVGHFVLASGRYPGPAGVLGNSWYSRELKSSYYCVEDSIAKPVGGEGKARSYRQTTGSSMGDWVKMKDSKSKVFTVAGKDRAAVFMGGKNADLAIYYNYKGSFITSDYYTNQLPGWLEDFNRKLNFVTYRDSVWDHFGPPDFYEKYGTPDYFYGEQDLFDHSEYSPTLPISLKSKARNDANKYIGATPWFDRTVLTLAGKLIREENLGNDQHGDLLCISMSAADWIGHYYGPHSHEVLDYYLRLDQYLMTFINVVEYEVGLDNVIFVLSSDHGTMPLPEYMKLNGIDAGRLNTRILKEKVARIQKQTNGQVVYEAGGFYFPYKYTQEQKSVAFDVIKTELADMAGIDTLITRETILNMEGKDPFERRMKNMIHPVKSADIFILLKENYCYKFPFGTSHGTPYEYDTHVPLIFSSINMQSKNIERSVETVDIAPTIGKLLNANIPEEVDGHYLREIIH